MTADLASQTRAERWHWHVIGVFADVQRRAMIAAAAEAPGGERAHTVGAHVAESREIFIPLISFADASPELF
jgi:hypothetical protein